MAPADIRRSPLLRSSQCGLARFDLFALVTQNAILFAKVASISMGVKTVSLLLATRCEKPLVAQLPEFCEFASVKQRKTPLDVGPFRYVEPSQQASTSVNAFDLEGRKSRLDQVVKEQAAQ